MYYFKCLLSRFSNFGLALLFFLPGCSDDTASSQTDGRLGDAHVDSANLRSDGGIDGSFSDFSWKDASVKVTWTKCDTKNWTSTFQPPAALECTTLQVPLDYSKPNGPTLSLRLARQMPTSTSSGKAIFYLAGGPGASAVEMSGLLPNYLEKLYESFDMIYLDQRGTGGSDYMGCAQDPTDPQTKQQWIDCAGKYTNKDLNHYLTLDAARDIEWARRALGYNKIYLAAGSYGTRLGLEYIRQYENNLVASFLVNIAPPDWDFFGDGIQALDLAITKLVDDCNSSTSCKQVCPDLRADLNSWRATVKKKPRPVTYDGKVAVEDEATFISFLQLILDQAKLRYLVPRALHLALAGNTDGWNRLLSTVSGYTIKDVVWREPAQPPSFFKKLLHVRSLLKYIPKLSSLNSVAPGLYATIICAEWLPNAGGIQKIRDLAGKQTWFGGQSILDIAEACTGWKVNSVESALRLPVTSKAKVLLMSGDLDDRTPPALGTHALSTLANSKHVVIPYNSHFTITEPCAAQIVSDFLISDGDLTKLDTSCIQQLKSPGW